jgi:uncharacterized protein (TIGR02271 family)
LSNVGGIEIAACRRSFPGCPAFLVSSSASPPLPSSPLQPGARVSGPGNFVGTLERIDDAHAEIRHRGALIVVPRSLLRVEGSKIVVPFDPSAAESRGASVVPVIAETLDVERERVTTGRVRVTKRVDQHEQVIDEPLLREEVEVERRRVDRVVDTAPPVRQEGDTTIVPLVEEVLVVEKRLMLREEIHLRRVRSEAHAPQTFVLKREHAVVERIDANPPDSTAQSPGKPAIR